MGRSNRKIYTVQQSGDGRFYPYIDSKNGDCTIHEARREAKRRNLERELKMTKIEVAPIEVSPVETEQHSIMGIGGIGVYAENEMPQIPTVAQMERMEKLERQATYCRLCGDSDIFDGAMFTTLGSSGICDDCV